MYPVSSDSSPPPIKKRKKHSEENSQEEQPISKSDALEASEWSETDIRLLLDRIEAVLPKNDNLSFQTRTKHIDWSQVAFSDYSAEDCKQTWLQVVKPLRHFRIAMEMVHDARVHLDQPNKKNNVRHPDMPKQAPNAFLLFSQKYRKNFIEENPGLPSKEILRMIGEAYRNLSPEKRAKWEKKAAKAKVLRQEQLDEFYREHPDEAIAEEMKKVKKVKVKTKKVTEGPKLPRTPVELYIEERKKENTVDEIKRLKERWGEISDKKKAKWIKLALLEQHAYEKELKAYALNHPEFKIPKHRNFVTREEIKILEDVYGRPSKPPQSSYQLFVKSIINDEEMDQIPMVQRMNMCANQWKTLSEVQKNEYKEQHKQLLNEYEAQLKRYLDSLPDDERVLEEEALMKKPEKVIPAVRKPKEKNQAVEEGKKPLSEILKNEPKSPPSGPMELFAVEYEGDDPLDDVWSSLPKKTRKVYEKRVTALKKAYDEEYEKFLNSMTKQQMERYLTYRNKSKETS